MRLDHEQKIALTRFAADLLKAVAYSDEMEFDEACRAAGTDPGRMNAVLWDMIRIGRSGRAGEEQAQRKWPQWKYDLLDQVVDTSRASTDHVDKMVQRLGDCLMAIPLSSQYAHVVHEYSGEWPREKRIGRPDDVPNHAGNPDEDVAAALTFLREPSRKTYILTGNDDFGPEVDDETRAMLKAIQVHVKADAARFAPKYLMGLDGMTPKHISQIYRAGMMPEG